MLGIPEEEIRPINRKRKKKNVSFSEDEEIINPEDIDPSVGKFRNLVQTTVIPSKKKKLDTGPISSSGDPNAKHMTALAYNNLYQDLPAPGDQSNAPTMGLLFPSSLSGKLGLSLPNPAPEVDLAPTPVEVAPTPVTVTMESLPPEPKKKKYAKEAWPGKKPIPSLLV